MDRRSFALRHIERQAHGAAMSPGTDDGPGVGPLGPARSGVLAGGVVAYNEERTIRAALLSLLDQELPPGVAWNTIWVVASGCTDRTVEEAGLVAARDPRVRLVVEPVRTGKATAVTEVLRRAQGDAVVLLNADARAMPGAVAALWEAAEGHPAPYAVMGHNVAPLEEGVRISGAMRLFWNIHNELHRELTESGEATHLSDELLLLSLSGTPELPEGIINDGAFLGAWLAGHGGRRLYAHRAEAGIDVPLTLRDHLTQRRRIHVGNRQVAELLGVAPTTLLRYTLQHPREALSLLRRTVREDGHDWAELTFLVVAELASLALSVWDRLPPRRDHVRWARIRRRVPWTPNTGP